MVDSANNECYSTTRTKGEGQKEPDPQFKQLATLETTSRVLMAAARSGS